MLWPFEPERFAVVTVAEIYPRVAYAETLPYRPKRKGDRFEPVLSVTSVLESEWFSANGLTIEHPDRASITEDDFDACITAIALLRRILENQPLVGPSVDRVAEGAMLLH